MAVLRKSFDQIMHENFEYEQRMNQQFLSKQSTAPGSVSHLLSSKRVMNEHVRSQATKSSVQQGKVKHKEDVFNLASYRETPAAEPGVNIARDEFDVQANLAEQYMQLRE